MKMEYMFIICDDQIREASIFISLNIYRLFLLVLVWFGLFWGL